MKIKRLIAFLIACTLSGGVNAFAENIDALEEDVIIIGENVAEADSGIYGENISVSGLDIASTEQVEVIFEDTYDFENYYMDGSKVTTSFVNNENYKMWEIRQAGGGLLYDVVPSGREGYGDALRIRRKSGIAGSGFFAHNNGSGNFMPVVNEGVVVIESDFLITYDTFPNYNDYILCQPMTDMTSDYMHSYCLRRKGDQIEIARHYQPGNSVVYTGDFPDGKWITMRLIFEYSTGKWHVDMVIDGVPTWLSTGNITPAIKTKGVQSVRTTYSFDAASGDETTGFMFDNFRAYKINNVNGSGYASVVEAVNKNIDIIRFNDKVFAEDAPESFYEDFSQYTQLPAALDAGTGKKWSGAVSGEFFGGELKVVEAPGEAGKKALFMSPGNKKVGQYAHAVVNPDGAEAISFDGRFCISGLDRRADIDLLMQKDGYIRRNILSYNNGAIYIGNERIRDVEEDKWYTFNMLISEKNKNAFVSVNDGQTIVEATVELNGISFENPIRMTIKSECSEDETTGGAYFTDLNVMSASQCDIESKIIRDKSELTVEPKIDLKFTNFVNKDEIAKIFITDGTEDVAVEVECIANSVKEAYIRPVATLKKNTIYTLDLSLVKDILGNALSQTSMTFKTGDPALMDIFDVNSVALKKGDNKLEYLKSGRLTVELDCTNVSPDATNAVLLLILYDEYKMEDIVVANANDVQSEGRVILKADMDVPSNSSNYRLRACVWDSEENAFALTKSYVFDSTGMVIE